LDVCGDVYQIDAPHNVSTVTFCFISQSAIQGDELSWSAVARTTYGMSVINADLRVVMIVIDALPHRHVSAELTPNIWRQACEGGRAPEGGLSLPMSVTYANHAAFITGVDPSETGVYGNHSWIDGEGWVPSPKAGPRARTLFDRVAAAGGRSVTVVGDHKLIAQMGGDCADEVWPPGGWIPDGTACCEFGYPADAAVVAAAQSANLNADLVVLHLNQPDTTSHLYGPDSSQAIKQYGATDGAYGELIDALADGWDHTVVITLSDHDQETIADQTSVALADALSGFVHLEVATDGTGALIHGDVGPDALNAMRAVPGIESAERLSEDVWMAWTEPGRMFDAAPITLGGQHGSPRCRTQLAIVSGGASEAEPLMRWVETAQPSALEWAPLIAELLGLEKG
jgi:hypothetical protein